MLRSGNALKGNIGLLRNSDGMRGLTLTELMIGLAVLSILVSMSAIQLTGTLRHMSVKSCAEQLATDIKLANASARAQGQRAVVAVTNLTGNAAQDFIGNGTKEFALTFIDANSNGAYDAGETVVTRTICDNTVVSHTDPTNNALSACPGIANALCLWFSSIGGLHTGAVNKNITMTNANDTKYLVRVNVISLTGYLRVQWCQIASGVDCSSDANWKDF